MGAEYYVIQNIKLGPDDLVELSDTYIYYDIYLVVKDLTDDERAELLLANQTGTDEICCY